MNDPVLWFLNRSTGLVLIGLLTLATVLGVLATSGRAGRGVPILVRQGIHRHVAVLSLTFLLAHIATAAIDDYVDIRWWQALVPWYGATYEPLALGLGTLASDLLVAVALTSALRTRLGRRSWHVVHLLSYVAWAVGIAHGLGIGTDLRDGVPLWFTVGCVVVVLVASTWRLARVGGADRMPEVVR